LSKSHSSADCAIAPTLIAGAARLGLNEQFRGWVVQNPGKAQRCR
jgi:hypothetical protein